MGLPGRDKGEQRRRAILASAVILLLLVASIVAATMEMEEGGARRAVGFVRIGAFMVLALVLSLRATTAFRFTPRNPALDDELTRANRASAALFGFWALIFSSLGLFAIALFLEPLSLIVAVPIFLACGGAASALRFVYLEGRGAAHE